MLKINQPFGGEFLLHPQIFFSPSRPDPERREKINFNFYFHTFCGTSKGFMKALEAFIKPF